MLCTNFKINLPSDIGKYPEALIDFFFFFFFLSVLQDGPLHVRIPAISRKPTLKEVQTVPVSVTSEEDEQDVSLGVNVSNINDTLAPELLNNSSDLHNSSLPFYSQDAPAPIIDATSDSYSSSNSKPLLRRSLRSSSDDSKGQQLSPSSLSPESFPSFSLTEEQIAALNISSKYFSKFPNSLNISTPLLDLPSSSSYSNKNLFPFASGSVILGRTPDPPRRKNVYLLIYSTGRLFPVLQTDLGDPAFKQGNWTVISPVVGISLGMVSSHGMKFRGCVFLAAHDDIILSHNGHTLAKMCMKMDISHAMHDKVLSRQYKYGDLSF